MLARKKQKQPNYKIYLTQGKYLDVSVWYYVKVDMLKLPLFQKALQSGNLNVTNYGEIIFSGWGPNPPDSIRRKMDEMYA